MATPPLPRFMDIKQVVNGYVLTIDLDPDGSYRNSKPQYTFENLDEVIGFVRGYFTNVRIDVTQS